MDKVKNKHSNKNKVNQRRRQIQKKKKQIPRIKFYIKDEHDSNYYIAESNNKEVEALLNRLNASKAKSKQIINDYKKEMELESRNTALVTKNSKTSLAKVNKKKKVNVKKRFKNTLIRLVIASFMLYIVFGVFFGLKRMNTIYMYPSVAEGDLLLYYRLDKDYNVGDIVYFNMEDKDYVLRIVAKEGQTITINEKNELLVDGHTEAHKSYYITETKEAESSSIVYPYTVEKGKVFVLGDYRAYTDDSRTFGAISEENIEGKIMGRFQIRNF